jgi:hypothetical protein
LSDRAERLRQEDPVHDLRRTVALSSGLKTLRCGAVPFTQPRSLTDNEIYSLAAFILAQRTYAGPFAPDCGRHDLP